ncbi:hypothetical protein EON62_00065 [archaeon]|nr:MAG: hypothetical protein EON62_00065 [archaeon]
MSDSPSIPPHLPCDEYHMRKGAFYRSLRPSPAIQAALTSVLVSDVWDVPPSAHAQRAVRPLTATFNAADAHGTSMWADASTWLGVHIRVHDASHDYKVVPSAQGSVTFGAAQSTTLSSLLPTLQRMTAARPGTRVLLVTNDCTGAVRRNMTAALPAAHIVSVADVLSHVVTGQYRRSKQQLARLRARLASLPFMPADPNTSADISVAEAARLLHAAPSPLRCHDRVGGVQRQAVDVQFAFLEWLVLAHAHTVLGSYWSSFSEEAAAVFSQTRYLTNVHGKYLALLPSAAAGQRVTCGYPAYINRARQRQAVQGAVTTFKLTLCDASTPAVRALSSTWALDASELYCVQERGFV